MATLSLPLQIHLLQHAMPLILLAQQPLQIYVHLQEIAFSSMIRLLMIQQQEIPLTPQQLP